MGAQVPKRGIDDTMTKTEFRSVDQYIATHPENVQAILQRVRSAIRKAVPGAEETISYQIPAYKLDGRYVVYFAGWKRHLSIYPIPDADEALEKELAPYRASKGTLRFRLHEPIPHELVARVAALLAQRRREDSHS